jgi:hypothetical protein
MIACLFYLFQEGEMTGGIPDIGVRLSIWIIGMFLLAVGGALIGLRIWELKKERESDHSTNN